MPNPSEAEYAEMLAREVRMLDDKGRCCGRKPMVYRSKWSTATGPHRFCPRCGRCYDLETGEQIPSWDWQRGESGAFENQTNRKSDA